MSMSLVVSTSEGMIVDVNMTTRRYECECELQYKPNIVEG